METWNTFTAGDLGLALIGIFGLITVVVTLASAQGKVNRREQALRQARIVKAIEAQLDEAPEAE